MNNLPPAPENVRVITPDGEYPLEMRYLGLIDGKHVWEATTAVPFHPRTHISCDRLPANTTIQIPTKVD